jgi:GNAT superfamily N-acetyltransferase
MIYLEKVLARPVEVPHPVLETIVFDPRTNADRFARILEQTYSGSLDCPAINGVRTGSEALEGHRNSGVFDASRWKIYRDGGIDAGVLLLNDHPEQNSWEVVYVGVVPEARGRGLGKSMLLSGLSEARDSGRASVLLAVDRRNKYARRVYSELGFVELGLRAVYVRISQRSRAAD